jgi:hypothetical protein
MPAIYVQFCPESRASYSSKPAILLCINEKMAFSPAWHIISCTFAVLKKRLDEFNYFNSNIQINKNYG